MQTQSEHIRVSPSTKNQLEEYRERHFDSYAPLGQAVAQLLSEVEDED